MYGQSCSTTPDPGWWGAVCVVDGELSLFEKKKKMIVKTRELVNTMPEVCFSAHSNTHDTPSKLGCLEATEEKVCENYQ